jgi:hypothetical protein
VCQARGIAGQARWFVAGALLSPAVACAVSRLYVQSFVARDILGRAIQLRPSDLDNTLALLKSERAFDRREMLSEPPHFYGARCGGQPCLSSFVNISERLAAYLPPSLPPSLPSSLTHRHPFRIASRTS